MNAQPYRGSAIRDGVALPRRTGEMRGWAIGCVVAAAIHLIVLFWGADHGLFEAAPKVTSTAAVFGSAWIVVVTSSAIRLVRGRTERVGRLLAGALAPALVAELYGALRFTRLGESTYDIASQRTALFAHAPVVRLTLYAATAVALAVAAVGAVGAVMSIDRERVRSKSEQVAGRGGFLVVYAAAAVGVLLALVFLVLRARGTHRDGLGGTLAIAGTVVLAVLGPLLVVRLRTLEGWHDESERLATFRIATCAVVAVGVAGITAERASLAYEEHRALVALREWTAFDVRFEHARAFASAWHAHGFAIVLVIAASLLPLLVLGRERLTSRRGRPLGFRRPSGEGLTLLVAITFVLVTAIHVHRLERVEPVSEVPVSTAISLPEAPAYPPRQARAGALRVGFGAAGSLEPASAAASKDPVLFVVDRSEPATRLVQALAELRAGVGTGDDRPAAILVEGASREALRKLDPAAAGLLGPRLSSIDLAVLANPFARSPTTGTTKDGVLLVLDDGDGNARLVYRTTSPDGFVNGKPRGLLLGRSPEARARRLGLASEIGAAETSSILLAPHPRGDVQALVDAMVALLELAPRAGVMLTTERDELEDAISGGAVVPR